VNDRKIRRPIRLPAAAEGAATAHGTTGAQEMRGGHLSGPLAGTMAKSLVRNVCKAIYPRAFAAGGLRLLKYAVVGPPDAPAPPLSPRDPAGCVQYQVIGAKAGFADS
jgi:hypothetical protein